MDSNTRIASDTVGSSVDEQARIGQERRTLRTNRNAQPNNTQLQNTSAPAHSVSLSTQPATTAAGLPRRRIKWSNEMNEFIIREYFRITMCERVMVSYRAELHDRFIEKYPDIGHITQQNIADRKGAIIRTKLITQHRIEEIRAEVEHELQQIDLQNLNNSQEDDSFHSVISENVNNSLTVDNRTHNNGTPNRISNMHDQLKNTLDEMIIQYGSLHPKYRPSLPKQHNSRKLIELTQTMDQNILPGIVNGISTYDQLQSVIYCAAAAITICNGGTIHHNKVAIKKPCKPNWEIRIENQMEQLRKDLARLIKFQKGPRTKRLKAKINKIRKKYKVHSKYEKNNVIIEQYIDTIKQKITVYKRRLKKYRKSYSRKKDNKSFKHNEGAFYRGLTEQTHNNNGNKSPISKEQIEEFWSNIWSQKQEHNSSANWIKTVQDQTQDITTMENSIITTDIFNEVITKMHNWKAPGIDRIHNYWLKKFKCLHDEMLSFINKFIQDPSTIPDHLCEGVTYLKGKNNKPQNPSEYRPLTCLNTFYKLTTACITNLINKHVENNNILAEEQKGSRRGGLGCKEQLTIDSVAMSQAVKQNRNLNAVFIDYKKAYDMVPHTWLIHILEIYKIHPDIIKFLETAMQQWNTRLVLNNGTSNIITDNIQINRGLFQGDSLSTLWFCLSINPLSTLLQQNSKGFNIKGHDNTQYNLTHLLYVDDLKIYANSQKNLENSLKITETFSKDIKMEFGFDKCRIQNIRKGKLVAAPPYILDIDKTIQSMDETEAYKYLGIQQTKTLQHTKIKTEIRKKFNNRLKLICKKSLNSRNLTKAINTYAIPILTYSFGIVKWTQTDLDNLGMDIRRVLRLYKYHHPQSAIERISLPRYEGGRGIIDIQLLHDKQLMSMRKFFYKKAQTSNLHSTITNTDDNYTPLDLINEHRQINPTTIVDRLNEWKSKPRQGQYPGEISSQYVDKSASFKWLTNGILFPETEGFFIAIQDKVLPTKNYRKYILKEQIRDDACRKCKTDKETIEHIMAGCTSLTQTEYKNRHDNMGKIVHKELAKKYKLTTDNNPDWMHRPEAVLENSTHKLLWDRTILTDSTVIHNRPDTILIDKVNATAYIIDYAVVNTNNLTGTYNTKIAKYIDLGNIIKTQWGITTVNIIPIVISTTGIIPKTTVEALVGMGLEKKLIDRLQFSVILNTCHIVRKFLNQDTGT